MSPSEGYMLKVANAQTLKYPEGSKKKNSFILRETGEALFDPAEFEFNGSVTAKVLVDGVQKQSDKDLLIAYVNDEIRGTAGDLHLEQLDSHIFPLMIYSNVHEGETVKFKYYSAEKNELYSCMETIPFTADMIVADISESMILNVNTDQANDIPDNNSLSGFKTYPNPISNILNIEYDIVEPAYVQLSVYDAFGKKIQVLITQQQTPDHYIIQWNPDLLPDGIYIIKLETSAAQMIRKVTLIR
jgi:hypothetical protein